MVPIIQSCQEKMELDHHPEAPVPEMEEAEGVAIAQAPKREPARKPVGRRDLASSLLQIFSHVPPRSPKPDFLMLLV